jgi:AAA domain
MDFISETQRRIVTDPHRVKLVNGCAGSRKTDTIVKLGLHHVLSKKHNILFLTLVSSITHELKCRMESLLGTSIPRVGTSNHYVGDHQGCTISIANFDAFVHRQLEDLDLGDDLRTNGDCHDWKTRTLHQATLDGRHARLVMKNGVEADFVLVDEFQDIDPLKAKILTNILRANRGLYGIAVGDMVQSVFPRAVSADLALGHPMNVWRSALDPEVYNISTCYRCPKAHIDFVECLLGEYYVRYGVPVMTAYSSDVKNRPVLFTHDRVTKNHGAYSIAAQVCAALRVLFRHDATLRPDDVAVIMKKSNNNHVFEQLKVMLEKLYGEDLGFPPQSITHFETRGDGYHNSIDWGRAAGKTVLLSVHGDKGKGHRVVFFPGVSHKSIPCENNVFKTQELIDVSLLNVGLTRSTEYLFVGFTADSPSRYIVQRAGRLEESAYTAWSAPAWSVLRDQDDAIEYLEHLAPPAPYREAITAMNSAWGTLSEMSQLPDFDRELRAAPLMCPDKDVLRVMEDASKDMTTAFESLFNHPEFQPRVTTFGKRFSPRTPLDEATLPMLGIMGELLVYRALHVAHGDTFLKKTFACVMSQDHIRFTDDDRVLNIVSDMCLNQYTRDLDLWKYMLKKVLKTHSGLMERDEALSGFFRSLLSTQDRPVTVLSSVFASGAFRKQLRVFLGKTESRRIPTRVFWNVALCFNELCESMRRPCVLLHFNGFNDNIDRLHDNISEFCRLRLDDRIKSLAFQAQHKLLVKEQDHEVLETRYGFVNHEHLDANRYTHGYMFGMAGKSDILDRGGGEKGEENNINNNNNPNNINKSSGTVVYELKTSARVDISKEWIAQALIYACVPAAPADMPASRFAIVNILSGAMYEFDMPEWLKPPDILTSVFEHYGFSPDMIERLLATVNLDRS